MICDVRKESNFKIKKIWSCILERHITTIVSEEQSKVKENIDRKLKRGGHTLKCSKKNIINKKRRKYFKYHTKKKN